MVQLLYGLALTNACENYASMSFGPYARPIESESLYFFFFNYGPLISKQFLSFIFSVGLFI